MSNLIKGARRFVTTVGSGGVSDASVTTIPLSSVEGLPTDSPVSLTIRRVDSQGNFTLELEEEVTGIATSTPSPSLISVTRGVSGTAQSHPAGSVVEAIFTAHQFNEAIDTIKEEHLSSGEHTPAFYVGMLAKVYPVGAIYLSTVATNPNTLFGFGTWVQVAQGKAIFGQNGSDTDFDTAEETGGSKTASLSVEHLAAHTHVGGNHEHVVSGNTGNISADHSHSFSATTSSNGAHTHSYVYADIVGINGGREFQKNDNDGSHVNGTTGSDGNHNHTVSGNTGGVSSNHTHAFSVTSASGGAVDTSSVGSGSAFSILNPYYVAYVFKRTA